VRNIYRALWIAALILSPARCVFAQFEDGPGSSGARIDKSETTRLKIGIEVTAEGGHCRGLRGTMPVPTAWPEQQVRIVEEKRSPHVTKVEYREVGKGAKQMLVEIARLPDGETASAYTIFEITRSSLMPPEDTNGLIIPKRVDREMQVYLGASPQIETRNRKIVELAKQAGANKSGWEKVEALYDVTRDKVQYKEGELKGAARALADGTGDCEELTSLFIALCRNNGVPARMVWVHGHCYPEFYLVDGKGTGYWFPCQAAGTRAFGGIPELRPILQKGDNFRDPDRPKEPLRYVSEFLKGSTTKGGGQPRVEFIRVQVNAEQAG
jgi:transglutaminase superfamily protein